MGLRNLAPSHSPQDRKLSASLSQTLVGRRQNVEGAMLGELDVLGEGGLSAELAQRILTAKQRLLPRP